MEMLLLHQSSKPDYFMRTVADSLKQRFLRVLDGHNSGGNTCPVLLLSFLLLWFDRCSVCTRVA